MRQTHGKTYKSLLEERTRFGIFQNNLRTIEEHNAKYANGEKSYYLKVTRFADMTHQEFKQMLGVQRENKPTLNATLHQFPENLEVPDSINWVEKGAVLEVKNQGNCGSCWSFSTTGSLEGQNAILNNVRTPLSEMQLLECSRDYGNGDCNQGGLMVYAFRYILDFGIQAESSYPYSQNPNFVCKYNAADTILQIKGFKEIASSETELKNAVGTIGPISVVMNSHYLQFYGGGVLSEPSCNDKYDHAVLAVGYGSLSDGTKYWIIKNSWGFQWGEGGYFRLQRDANNMCGIATMSSYPVLK